MEKQIEKIKAFVNFLDENSTPYELKEVKKAIVYEIDSLIGSIQSNQAFEEHWDSELERIGV